MAALEGKTQKMNINDQLDEILLKMGKMQENSHQFIKDIIGNDLYTNLLLLKTTKERLEALEDEQRRRNVVFYGIPDESKENYQELRGKIMDVLNKSMGLKIHGCELDHFYRLGQYSQEKTRPVMVKLNTQWRKADILHHSFRLRGLRIYVVEHLSKLEEKERRELMPILRELRSKGKYVVFKRNKLYVDGVEYNKETENSKQGNPIQNIKKTDEEQGVEESKNKQPSNNKMSSNEIVNSEKQDKLSELRKEERNQKEIFSCAEGIEIVQVKGKTRLARKKVSKKKRQRNQKK